MKSFAEEKTQKGYHPAKGFFQIKFRKRRGGEKKNDKAQAYMAASEQLRKAFPTAIAALREIAGDKEAPAAARATAAKTLLEYGTKMDELSRGERFDFL